MTAVKFKEYSLWCVYGYSAKEAKKEQISIVLGCGINIKRSPLCGRNFEYFSEDPYLTGKLATGYIEGVQLSLIHI